MQFLKGRRMDAVYRELLGADPGATSVTDIAVRYGFTHLGRFAVEYKHNFQESPSATLTDPRKDWQLLRHRGHVGLDFGPQLHHLAELSVYPNLGIQVIARHNG
jgi:AraC-like DNA-binding protein